MIEYTDVSISSCPILKNGSDNIAPIKLEIPPNTTIILNPSIFPIANCSLLIGVTSSVAIVPLSFSPAIESGATDAQILKSMVISNIGNIIDTN